MGRKPDIEKNLKIKESYANTLMKRQNQTCKVFTVKIQQNKLNSTQKEFLKMVFVEAKWLYNHLLSMSKEREIFSIKYTDINEVTHYDKDRNTLVSELTHLSSQMKQGVLDGIFTNIRSLNKAKKKGNKVGALKFISEYKSVNLKQYDVSYKILGKNKIKVQGCKKPFNVNGLKQIFGLREYDIANAKLVKNIDGYFIAITVYVPKEEQCKKEHIGVDFGCQTSLTFSNGVKMNCVVEEHDRIKRLKRKAAKQTKGSNNSMKTWNKIKKLNVKLSRKRNDAANKVVHELKKFVVVMQDEQINEWKHKHGKKVQYGILGRVKEKLKKMETTVVLDKWLPTTKLCTCCGEKADIKLYDRIFVCPKCGHTMDRDIHAAQNMLWLYENIVGTGHTEVKPVEFDEILKKCFIGLKQEAAKSLV